MNKPGAFGLYRSSSSTVKTKEVVTVKKGGSSTKMGGKYNVAVNTKVGFNTSTARQSTDYSGSAYKADWAFKGPNRFTHTKNGVGQWWEVGFN